MSKLKPVHPGEVLWEDFMKPRGLNPHRLALDLHVSAPTVYEIVHCKRAITTEMALRLAHYFGTTPQFWMNLETKYELDVAEDRRLVEKIDRTVRPVTATTSATR